MPVEKEWLPFDEDEEDIPENRVREAIEESLRLAPYLPPEPPPFTSPLLRRPLDGLPTGFADLDALTGGLQPGELTIVAGFPSCGASTFLQNLARKAIRREGRGAVALVSLDTTGARVVNRILCAQARIDTRGRDARYPGTEVRERLAQARSKLEASRLKIGDWWDATLEQITTNCATLKQQDDLELVLVDTVQRIATPGGGTAKLPEVMQGLKQLAGGLEVPVVAVCRLEEEPIAHPKPSEAGFQQFGDILNGIASGNAPQALGPANVPVPMPVKLFSDTLAILHRPDRGRFRSSSDERQKGLEIVTLSVARQVGGGPGEVHLTFLTRWGRMGGILWEA